MKILSLIAPLFLSILLLSLGCSSDDIDPKRVEIRIRNTSSVSMVNVVANINGEIADFGTVAAFSTTNYQFFTVGYPVATINTMVNGNAESVVVTEYTGVSPINQGTFTYELGLDCTGSNCDLTFNFKDD